MRKNKIIKEQTEFSILTLDDDQIMTVTLQSYFQSSGYTVDIENDPYKAIERVKEKHYDILLLDFLMKPICGDVVVEKIREFNSEIFIILLTGHKSMAPPIQTIRELDIQGYYEKSDRFDQLELLVESCVKSIRQMRVIKNYQNGLKNIVEKIPEIYHFQPFSNVIKNIVGHSSQLLSVSDIYLCAKMPSGEYTYYGVGTYENAFGVEEDYVENYISNGELRYTINSGVIVFPLIDARHEVFGVIKAQSHKRINSDIAQVFELYVKQACSAISNALLHSLLNDKNRELEIAYSTLGLQSIKWTQGCEN